MHYTLPFLALHSCFPALHPPLVTYRSLVPCSPSTAASLNFHCALASALRPVSILCLLFHLPPCSVVIHPRSSLGMHYTFTSRRVCTTPRLSLPPKQLPAASHHSHFPPPAFEALVVTSSFSFISLAVNSCCLVIFLSPPKLSFPAPLYRQLFLVAQRLSVISSSNYMPAGFDSEPHPSSTVSCNFLVIPGSNIFTFLII